MPKIAEIEDTPNPNAVKFILMEPLTWGLTRSYDNAEQAQDDALASTLFDIEHVTNVFYVDRWLTVTQDGEADWPELVRKVADPRAAPAADQQSAATWSASTATSSACTTRARAAPVRARYPARSGPSRTWSSRLSRTSKSWRFRFEIGSWPIT